VNSRNTWGWSMRGILIGSILLTACEESEKLETEPLTEDGELLSDSDGDGYLSDEDCDDGDPTINPGADEICDGFDNNCDNQADEEVTETFYADSDGDGFGNEGITTESCSAPAGYATNGSDCDDTDPATYPSAEEVCDTADNNCDGDIDEGLEQSFFLDADGDGFGGGETVEDCELREGLSSISGDCDDEDASLFPLADELCDGIDNNCDGSIDEGVTTLFYADQDEDGFGDDTEMVEACEQPEGHVLSGGDCDDLESYAHPEAVELCDGIDNDCDGLEDEDDAEDTLLWYSDSDGDGHGDPAQSQSACSQPSDHVGNADDCDDDDDDIGPDSPEICNGQDDNCDGSVDEGSPSGSSAWYMDADDDGAGDPLTMVEVCDAPEGHVSDASDCDDNDDDVNPDALELCNGEDDDCDGGVDEDSIDLVAYYADADSDGFGDAASVLEACEMPAGHSLDATDCDDESSTVFPEAAELCDGIDNDCDGATDEEDAQDAAIWFSDSDADGFGDAEAPASSCSQPEGRVEDSSDCDDSVSLFFPGAVENCDGYDNDCDGDVDEDDSADAPLWYGDADGDGYGDPLSAHAACEQPSGHVEDSTDCDDGQDDTHPGATELCNGVDDDCDEVIDEESNEPALFYVDADGDGFGDSLSDEIGCSLPEGHSLQSGDCDDAEASISPAGEERCNGIDDNCDGLVDDADPLVQGGTNWSIDHDGDGHGSSSYTLESCDQPTGFVEDATDCDDLDSGVNPAASEICNGKDDNCNLLADDEDSGLDLDSALTWYLDSDGDGYGDASQPAIACMLPANHTAESQDCHDGDAEINPAAVEVCDGQDNDCNDLVDDEDGGLDEGTGDVYYVDVDGDDFGTSESHRFCVSPEGYASVEGDCDDGNADYAANCPPAIIEVLISPESPTVENDIQCLVTSEDSEGGVITVEYQWMVEGSPSETTMQLHGNAGYFAYGESVQCCATPFDGELNGDSRCGSEVLIENTPPVIESLSLLPDSANTNQDLSALAVSSDADGHDVLLSYDWYVEGELVQSGEESNLDSEHFTKHQTVLVQATPSDEIDEGEVFEASLAISNTPPEGPAVTVVWIDAGDGSEVAAPTPGEDDLYCQVDVASDPDGDTLSYEFSWTVNSVEWTGDLAETTHAGDTVSGSDVSADETWACSLTVSDDDGAVATSDASEILIEYALGEDSSNPGFSCADIQDQGASTGDGVYYIDPFESGAFEAFCEMSTDGGGWTLVEWIIEGFHTYTDEELLSALHQRDTHAKMSDSDIRTLALDGAEETMITGSGSTYVLRYSTSEWNSFSSTGWTNTVFDSKDSDGAWQNDVCNGHYNNRGFSTYSDMTGGICTVLYDGSHKYFSAYHTSLYAGGVGGEFGIYVR
jgi:hypothetical protein